MSGARVQANPQSSLPFGEEAKPGFRTKTAATRLTPEELSDIETAAEGAGQALSEWLRATALQAARKRPADPAELVLAEVWALRYALLNLFHAGAQAASEGRQMSSESILKSATKPMRASSNRLANCFPIFSRQRARKEDGSHE